MSLFASLKGRVTVITGASSGIGEGIAKVFATNGSHLVLGARRVDRLEALQKELIAAHGIKVFIHPLDVTSRDSVEKFVSAIPADLKDVDVLVNNAGLALGVKHVFENNLDDIDNMVDVNVKGVLYVLRAFVPGFLERKRGDIVNISSVAGLEGYPGGSVYCATKHAVQGLTEALRKEVVATPIRVSSVCPGLVETEFSEIRFGGDKDKAKTVYKGINALCAADVADAVAYVTSRPPHVQISDLVIYPTNQAAVCSVHKEQ